MITPRRFARSLRGLLRTHTVSFRLIGLVLASTSAIFIAAFIYNYTAARSIMLGDAEVNARHQAEAVINRILLHAQVIQKLTEHLALQLSAQRVPVPWLFSVQRHLVEYNNDIFGTCAAFEPFSFDATRRFFAPYHFKHGGLIDRKILGGPSYDYFSMPWYRIPRETGQPAWTGPYYDEGGGNILMATYSVPFYRASGGTQIITGVATVDVSIDWLKGYLSTIRLYESGYTFLITRGGTYITHPDRNLPSQESIREVAARTKNAALLQLADRMAREENGTAFISDFHTGKQSFFYFRTLKEMGWVIVIVVPEEEIFGELRTLERNIVIILVGGLFALFVAVLFISNTITHPIHSLSRVAQEISRGNLDIAVPHTERRDEIGMLAGSFLSMELSLREYIDHLQETTAAKERIESELKVARSIQMSFIPSPTPPERLRGEYAIAATIEMAKEVGGDLYDFFPIDDDRLFLLIGDVSGKGVPAALFMAVTRTLFRAFTATLRQPSALLARINNELCRDNDSSMFVSVFCGVFNIRTGDLIYSNAGHNPPILIGSDRAVAKVEVPPGLVLGAGEDAGFLDARISLKPGDMLLAYTDGVTEALNDVSEFFGEDGLLGAAPRAETLTPDGMAAHVIGSVRAFANGAPQSDDITVLCLQYRGIRSSGTSVG